MDFKAVFLLFILVGSCICRCSSTNSFPIHNPIVSVLEGIDHLPKGEYEITKESDWNDKVCIYCEDFTSMALDYVSNNKTQDEIFSILHKSCSKVLNFKQQCKNLVDHHASLFFKEVSSVQPEAFCKKIELCDKIVSIYRLLSKNSCTICHHFITQALMKLKDPDTQLDIVQDLMKACEALQGDTKKCKKLVIEYGPLILDNAEEFIEKNDVCAILHACDPATAGI